MVTVTVMVMVNVALTAGLTVTAMVIGHSRMVLAITVNISSKVTTFPRKVMTRQR